jgi:hypothetical protein
MGKLDSLKIDSSPLAFATFAAKHNALVDLLASMQGQNGISVVIAEKNAIIRGNVASSTSNGNASISGNTANVVGSTGLLQNVYIGNTIANAWPSAGKWVTASGNIEIDASGFRMTTTGGKVCNIAFATLSQNVALRTEAYCNNNTAANIMVVASSPY